MQNIAKNSIAGRVAAFSLAATLAGGFAANDDAEAAKPKSSPKTEKLAVAPSGLYKIFEASLAEEGKKRGIVFDVDKECNFRPGRNGIVISGIYGSAGGPGVSDKPTMGSSSDVGIGDNNSYGSGYKVRSIS